ncbi:MAG: AAA family ATPase [Lachnospiraceae bacterium]|nr:AAA family ATPase [Lachnospiraceae bacterium]
MIFNKVRIKNFRGIQERTFDFSPGFNLIVGENGKGKTSILEAIAVGMGGFVAGISEVSTRHFMLDEIRKEYKKTGDGSCEAISYVPVEVEIEAQYGDKIYSWIRTRTSVNASRSTIQPRDIVRLAEKESLKEGNELPILVYEAAARIWAQKRQKVTNPFGKKYIRTLGYMDALVDASNIKMIRNWCVKMEMSSFKMRKDIEEYEAVKKAVANFMSLMNEDEYNEYSIFFDTQLEEIMFQRKETILPVSSLSAGYQSLVWMVFDIAYRMALLNPHRGREVMKTKGVVLIDELDMHLHPKWQWNVINALHTVFPNVQFIATTHAPILFASAKKVNILNIESDEIKYKTSHYGIDINLSVEEFQNTSEYPLKVKQLVDSIQDMLDVGAIREADNIFENLETELGENHPIVTKYKTLIELEKIDWGE